MSDIQLIFFDDSVFKFKFDDWSPYLSKLLNGPSGNDGLLSVSNPRACLHVKWNGLDSVAIDSYNQQSEKLGLYPPKLEEGCLVSKEHFISALEWCRSNAEKGICFFDFEYGAVKVEIQDLADEAVADLIGELFFAHRKVRHESLAQLASYLNETRAGLLLVAALAVNSATDTDILIVSSAINLHIEELSVLTELLKRRAICVTKAIKSPIDVRSSYPETAYSHILEAINKHIEVRLGGTKKFWPDDSASWFKDNSSYPMHSRPEPPDPQELIGRYLIELGADRELALKWLQDLEFYKVMKHFVGIEALTGGGKRPLLLGSLIFPLLAAAGKQEWMAKLEFRNGQRVVFPSQSSSMSRRFILYVYNLFHALSRPMAGTLIPNSTHALEVSGGDAVSSAPGMFEWCEEENRYVFWVEFCVNCTVGRHDRPSLLEGISTRGILTSPGDATGFFRELQSLVEASGCSDRLKISLAPISKGNVPWTRLAFEVTKV